MSRFLLRFILASLFIAVAVLFGHTAGITVSPSTVSNAYTGDITLAISGLTSGQMVQVEQVHDINGNGVIDTGEPVLSAFSVSDGVRPMIGGVRASDLPGDEDGVANGAIQAKIHYRARFLEFAVGKYVFCAFTGSMTRPTAPFTVTANNYGQSISGRVLAGGVGLAGARPYLAIPGGSDNISGALTDAAGNFTISCPPGTYLLGALKTGYLTPWASDALIVSVAAGQSATGKTLTLSAVTRHIRGKVIDVAGNIGISGVGVSALTYLPSAGSSVSPPQPGGITSRQLSLFGARATSSDPPLAMAYAYTDAQGNFDIPVGAGVWLLAINGSPSGTLSLQGYVPLTEAKVMVSTLNGDANGLILRAAKCDSMIVGTVKNTDGAGLPGVGIWLLDDYGNGVQAWTDANGAFAVPVIRGRYVIWVDDYHLQARGYLSCQDESVFISNVQVMTINFVVQRITAHLKGHVVDDTTAPVAGACLVLYGETTAGEGFSKDIITAADGSFDFGVVAGDWNIEYNDDDSYTHGVFGAISQSFTVPPANENITFVLQRATSHLSGRVVTNTQAPVPNLALRASSDDNSLVAFTAADGTFNIPVGAGAWELKPNAALAQLRGLFGVVAQEFTTPPDHANIVFTLQQATAHATGKVYDDSMTPLAGIKVSASNASLSTSPWCRTDAGGNFDIPLPAGTFAVSVDDPEAQRYDCLGNSLSVTMPPSASNLSLVLKKLTVNLSGTITRMNGDPITDARLSANGLVNGHTFYTTAYVDNRGLYQLRLLPGAWTLVPIRSGLSFTPRIVTFPSAGSYVENFTPDLVRRPDQMVRNEAETTWTGDNFYAVDAMQQYRMQTVGIGQAARYFFRVQNDGDTTDSFLLTRIQAGTSTWTVTYTDTQTGANIAAFINGGGYTIGPLLPGQSRDIFVTIAPPANAVAGDSEFVKLQVSSLTTPQLTDPAGAMARLGLRYQADLWIRKTYDTAYAGDNIISTTGEGQTRGTYANPFLQGQFIFRIQNDGVITDNFCVTAPAAPVGWVTKYYRSPSNEEITAQVTGSGWITPGLAPGASECFYLMTRPLPYVALNTTLTRYVTAVSLSNPARIDVLKTMTVVNAGYQPDLWLRTASETAYIGDNICNTTAAGQTKAQTKAANVAATYLFRVQNDGNVADSVKLTGTAAVSGWTMQYYDSATGANITSQVTGSGWTTPTLARGTHVGLYVKVTPLSTVTASSTQTVTLTAVSTHNAASKDVVKCVTTKQ